MINMFYNVAELNQWNYLMFVVRLVLAVLCGAVVGFERERKLKTAGPRTHAIVALGSALLMIISKYAFFDVTGVEGVRISADASRIAHGVISAIGFLGAGVICIRRETPIGLTTAAGLWATVGIGLAIGAGMEILGIVATIFVLLTQFLMKTHHSKKVSSMHGGTISVNLTKHKVAVSDIATLLHNHGATIKEASCRTEANGDKNFSARFFLESKMDMLEILDALNAEKIVDNAEIYPML